VLKGNIAVDSAVFPAGTPGCMLDSFARQHLWAVGLDFIHGTRGQGGWEEAGRRESVTLLPNVLQLVSHLGSSPHPSPSLQAQVME